ncbi:MAG: type II secretion system protein F [Nocardioides sp.]|nr:type II secretion system protein F [Nocardioides sp.]
MGVLVGLGVGTGLLLIWSAFALPRVESASSSAPRTDGRVRRLLSSAGMADTSTGSFLGVCAVAAVVAFVVVQAMTGTWPVAVAFAAMGAWGPVALVRSRARKRRREFAEVWPEAIDDLASAVRAGLSLPDALAGLAVRGPEALRPAFASFALDYQVTGRFGDCLDRLKERLADPVGDRVAEGLRIARDVGGGELGRLLRALSGYLREELHTRSELESRQAWVVNGARLAVSAPWVVLLLMSGQRDVVTRYQSTAGVLVLAVGAALCVLAYVAMNRVGRLPTEQRILS